MGTLLNTATWKSVVALIAGILAGVDPGNHFPVAVQIVILIVAGAVIVGEHFASAIVEHGHNAVVAATKHAQSAEASARAAEANAKAAASLAPASSSPAPDLASLLHAAGAALGHSGAGHSAPSSPAASSSAAPGA